LLDIQPKELNLFTTEICKHRIKIIAQKTFLLYNMFMKKPHIKFNQVHVGDGCVYAATVTGDLSWTPMLSAYGYGMTIRSAIERAWERWEMQVASDICFPWSAHD
jgi:hypothetical protein